MLGDDDVTPALQARAAAAEQHVLGTYVRQCAALPGTRLGSPVPHPGRRPVAFAGTWNYWWQAHLLDALVDAERRRPDRRRRRLVHRVVRGVALRNVGWTNVFHDDMAWLALALLAAGEITGRPHVRAVRVLTDHLRECRGSDGLLTWRHDDRFRNAPTNGAAALLFARTGDVTAAVAIVEWLLNALRDPATGLVVDGVQADGHRTEDVWTYNQGLAIGALVELVDRTGASRWSVAARELIDAVRTHLTPGDVVVGAGGGDGGLFAGILVRHLARAVQRLADRDADQIVRASADAAWRSRDPATGMFSADWRRPACVDTDRDLSVQLAGWLALEAAAGLGRPARSPAEPAAPSRSDADGHG